MVEAALQSFRDSVLHPIDANVHSDYHSHVEQELTKFCDQTARPVLQVLAVSEEGFASSTSAASNADPSFAPPRTTTCHTSCEPLLARGAGVC
jgi:hypothetical protein